MRKRPATIGTNGLEALLDTIEEMLFMMDDAKKEEGARYVLKIIRDRYGLETGEDREEKAS